jgi:two-component system, NarL family, invasion response regulator UvrY
MNDSISVLLVDDHAVVREGYRRLLEDNGIRVIAEASTATEAYQQFCILAPSVVVMDIALTGVSGIEGTRRILARSANARVLVFSMYEEIIFVRRALDAGAAGYLTKSSAPRVLVEAVTTVARGQRYLSHDVAVALALAPHPNTESVQPELSAREFEVLKLLAQGYSSADIAKQLCRNQKTVANHQSAIKQKLGADNTAQLVRIAMQLGLVPPIERIG